SGATNTTLNIPNAMGSDSGVYTVDVSNDGGTTTSQPVTLNANNLPIANADSLTATQNTAISISASSLLANDSDPEGEALSITAVSGIYPVTWASDFNNGVPAGAQVLGANGGGLYDTTGGVENSGVVKLTLNANNHAGALILDDLSRNRRVSALNARFKLRIGDGSAETADH